MMSPLDEIDIEFRDNRPATELEFIGHTHLEKKFVFLPQVVNARSQEETQSSVWVE